MLYTHGAECVILSMCIYKFQSTIVVLTSDAALVVGILELTLKDEGDVMTKVNGEISLLGVH